MFNTNVGKMRVSEKSIVMLLKTVLLPCCSLTFTGMTVTVKWLSDSKYLYYVTPSSPRLALTEHCSRKEEAKLSCDPWRRIQQEKCWLVTDESTGIRHCSARCLRWPLEESSWVLGMPRRQPNTKTLNVNIHFYLRHQALATWRCHCLLQWKQEWKWSV